MATLPHRAVLFADLRGSTALYGAIGNEAAARWVSSTVSVLGQQVPAVGGRVVKTLGDGLMAVFDHPAHAIESAERMHGVLDDEAARPTPAGADTATDDRRLQLQVAVAHGELVELDDDCFGDAVNLAARLLDHAGDNETLVTGDALRLLPSALRQRFRSLDHVQVRGRSLAVEVHVLARRSPDTAATMLDIAVGPPAPHGVRLTRATTAQVLAMTDLPAVIGRSARAQVVVDDARVSRSHARIEWHGGTLQLVDLSFNGTYVRFANDDEVLSLRRGSCTLHGSGDIGLGSSPDDPAAAVLHFDVLRSAPTPAP